ncbi:MAG TPA: hypothetical protein DCR24_10530 [Bacillus bacterium]|nr:hypothetical protein [Bacillus sp. (in: firmicutes)]
MTKYLGIHETLEVLEILTFKSLTLTKSTTMSGLVQDIELKNILLSEMNTAKEHVQHLKELLTNREEAGQ